MLKLSLLVLVLALSCCYAKLKCSKYISATKAEYEPLEQKLRARNRLCQTYDRTCAGTDIQVKYTPTPLGCVALCRRREDCMGAFYSKDKYCHLRAQRCASPKVVHPQGFYYYRMDVEEEKCPQGSFLYSGPPRFYADTYCQIKSKRCMGEGYYRKPRPNFTLQQCVNKCSWIVTCHAVSYNAKEKLCDLIDIRGLFKRRCQGQKLKSNAAWDTYVRSRNKNIVSYVNHRKKWMSCGNNVHTGNKMWFHEVCEPESDAKCKAEKRCATKYGFKNIDNVCMRQCYGRYRRFVNLGCKKLQPSFEDTKRCRIKYTYGVPYSKRNQAYKNHRKCVKDCEARQDSGCHKKCLTQVGLKHISTRLLTKCLRDATRDFKVSCFHKQRDIRTASELKKCVTYN